MSGLTWIKWLIIRAKLEIYSAQTGEFAHHYTSASNASYPETGPFHLKLQAATAFFINLTSCYINTHLITSGFITCEKRICFTVAFNIQIFLILDLRMFPRNYFKKETTCKGRKKRLKFLMEGYENCTFLSTCCLPGTLRWLHQGYDNISTAFLGLS